LGLATKKKSKNNQKHDDLENRVNSGFSGNHASGSAVDAGVESVPFFESGIGDL
jgi:hypothetical protein